MTARPSPTEDNRQSLLASPYLWFGGAVCWAIVFALGWALSRAPL